MFATIWNGTTKPKNGKRDTYLTWLTPTNKFPRPYGFTDDSIDGDEELPDDMPKLSDEPMAPHRRPIVMRHVYAC